jgi:hypothetical protein
VTSSNQCNQPGLAQRMRDAANTIEEFNQRNQDIWITDARWRPSELRREAEHVDAEEREKAERDAEVEELGHDIFKAFSFGRSRQWESAAKGIYRTAAKIVLDAGWHK